MKLLKIIGILLLVVIAAVLILGLILPKDYNVKRDIVINAPEQTVYKGISTFAMFDQWNPWNKLDSTQKVELTGTDGTVGAKRSWKGNDKVGEGAMTITNLVPNQSVNYQLDFIKPFKSTSQVTMSMEKAEGGYKVTWAMAGKMPYPFNVMSLFGNMDKQIGSDFESGLKTLKELSEKAPAAAYEVKEIQWPATEALGIRKTVKFPEMSAFFASTFPEAYKAISSAGAKPGTPLGIYYKYDEQAMEADMAAAVPYEGKKVLAKGLSNISIPAQQAYLIDYYGAYDENMKAPYNEMAAFLKKNFNRENPDLVIEQYLSDPMQEPDTTKWHTAIYFFVSKEQAAAK